MKANAATETSKWAMPAPSRMSAMGGTRPPAAGTGDGARGAGFMAGSLCGLPAFLVDRLPQRQAGRGRGRTRGSLEQRHLLRVMAGHLVARAHGTQGRYLLAALLRRHGAARMETAAGRRIDRTGNVAGGHRLVAESGIGLRRGRQQRLGIGVARTLVEA